MHLNPVIGQPEPHDGVQKSDTDFDLFPSLMLYAAGAFALDEIRVGETYESVTPAGK